jgi:hypothetical protein
MCIPCDEPTNPPQRERRQAVEFLAPKRACVRVERLAVGVGVGIEAGHERLRSSVDELATSHGTCVLLCRQSDNPEQVL